MNSTFANLMHNITGRRNNRKAAAIIRERDLLRRDLVRGIDSTRVKRVEARIRTNRPIVTFKVSTWRGNSLPKPGLVTHIGRLGLDPIIVAGASA